MSLCSMNERSVQMNENERKDALQEIIERLTQSEDRVLVFVRAFLRGLETPDEARKWVE